MYTLFATITNPEVSKMILQSLLFNSVRSFYCITRTKLSGLERSNWENNNYIIYVRSRKSFD